MHARQAYVAAYFIIICTDLLPFFFSDMATLCNLGRLVFSYGKVG